MEFSPNTQQILNEITSKRYQFSREEDTFFLPNINNNFCNIPEKIELLKVDETEKYEPENKPELEYVYAAIKNLFQGSNEGEFEAYWEIKKISKNKNELTEEFDKIKQCIKNEFFSFVEKINVGISFENFEKVLEKLVHATKETSALVRSVEYSLQHNLDNSIFEHFVDYINDERIKAFNTIPFRWCKELMLADITENEPLIKSLHNINENMIKLFGEDFFLSSFREYSTLMFNNFFAEIHDNIEFTKKCITFIEDTDKKVLMVTPELKERAAECLIEPLFNVRFYTDIDSVIRDVMNKNERPLLHKLTDIISKCLSENIKEVFFNGLSKYITEFIDSSLSKGILSGMDEVLHLYIDLSQSAPQTIKSFKKSLNEKPLTNAFAFASYCNCMIKAKGDSFSESVDGVMKIFREFDAIDSVLDYYSKFLALRLLSYSESIPEIELTIVNQINTICNNQFSQNMLSMINDTREALENIKESKVLMKVSIFHTIKYEVWTPYSSMDFDVPKVIEDDFQVFQNFYKRKNGKRVLKWLKILDTCTFTVNGVEITCSGLHYNILDCINKGKKPQNDQRSNSALKDLIAIKLVEKRGDELVFVPPHEKTVVPRLQELIPQVQTEEQDEQLKKIKKSALESLIVLIVKEKKDIPREDIYIEALSRQSRFNFSKEELEKVIDSLLDREYISKTSDNIVHFDLP